MFSRILEKMFIHGIDQGGQLRETAETAYQHCVHWFGPPPDQCIQFFIWKGRRSVCAYSHLFKCYFIQISEKLVSKEQMYSAIAHEMFHRITMRRPGVHRERWISEMLAFLTSQSFLKSQGLEAYADYIQDWSIDHSERVCVAALRGAKRRSGLSAKIRSNQNETGFGIDISRLAIALETIVSFEALVRLVGVDDLDRWIKSLPAEFQAPICHILELPNTASFPEDPDMYDRFGYALHALGNRIDAIQAYQQAARLRPDDPKILARLGQLLYMHGQQDSALSVWQQAIELATHDISIYCTIAVTYLHQQEYERALSCLKEALSHDKSAAEIHYILASVYHAKGDYPAAKQEWHKVIEFNSDPRLVEQALRALEENK